MTQFSTGPAVVRRGEFTPFPGVRSRVRSIPFPGLELSGADPWKGGYRKTSGDQDVSAGPESEPRWEEALAGAPSGCVLVGPVAECEPVYGSASAALRAARSAGRGAVVVDALCDPRDLDLLVGGEDLVWVAVWREGDEGFWTRAERAREKGRSGVALPLIPGWTAESSFLRVFLARARAAGVEFAAGFEVPLDGASRAAIHSDFAAKFPDRADDYFDELHHRDASAAAAGAWTTFAREAETAGIPVRAPLPRGRADFEANLRAREALEFEADRLGEPSASVLRAASRRIEDFDRDLADLAKRGNGRLLFPPESREWRIIENAIGLALSPRR
jgi:hypothetical protein